MTEPNITVPQPLDGEDEKLLAAAIIKQLYKGKKIHDAFADNFRKQYLIAGKLMKDWKEHFKIALPPDLNPQLAQSIDAKLMEYHQEACFYKAEAEARLAAFRSARDKKYREAFTTLTMEYKNAGQKIPAKDTLGTLAEQSIADINEGLIHAEIEVSFFKEILGDLDNSRKLLESAVISISVEAKALQNERYLDALNRKKEY